MPETLIPRAVVCALGCTPAESSSSTTTRFRLTVARRDAEANSRAAPFLANATFQTFGVIGLEFT
jgi:hypothetical protein